MPKTTTALETPLRNHLDRLAAFEPVEAPVVSLYLDLRPNEHGKHSYEPFLRRALHDRGRTLHGDARKSFDRDAHRITDYLAGVPPSANGVAIFACAAAHDFFDAVPLVAPMQEHWLHLGPVPNLYPLARLNDQYPRYAALLLDTNSARIVVFSLAQVKASADVAGVKTKHSSVGGTSQARYQRHNDDLHLKHMKEVVGVLDRVVRDERLQHVAVACDEVARPLLMQQLPKHLAAKIIDVRALDMKAPNHRVLAATLDALHQRDATTDAEHVEAMIGAWRAGGLAVAGPVETLEALARHQVEELLITATPQALDGTWELSADRLAVDLVTLAQKNGARIRFIEDTKLLEYVGGVGALLRFKIPAGDEEAPSRPGTAPSE